MSAPRGVRLPEPIRFRGVIPATGWSAAFGEVDPDGAVEVWFVPVIFWAIRAGSDAGPGIDDDAVVAIIRDEDAPGGLAAIVDDRTTGLSFLGLVTEAERREDEDGVLEHFKDLVRWRHERAEAIRARDAERAEVERGRGLIMLEGWLGHGETEEPR